MKAFWDQPIEGASELCMLNTRQHGSGGAKVDPGYPYRLPPPAGGINADGRTGGDVCGLTFLGADDTGPNMIDGDDVLQSPDFALWTLTVKDLDGHILAKDVPAILFLQQHDPGVKTVRSVDWRRVDPRQSYLTCHEPFLDQTVILYRWIYGNR